MSPQSTTDTANSPTDITIEKTVSGDLQVSIVGNTGQIVCKQVPVTRKKAPYYPFLRSKPGGTLPSRTAVALANNSGTLQAKSVDEHRLLPGPLPMGGSVISSTSITTDAGRQFKAADLVNTLAQLTEKSIVERYQLQYDYSEAQRKKAEWRCKELEDKVARLERIRGEEKGRSETTITQLKQQLAQHVASQKSNDDDTSSCGADSDQDSWDEFDPKVCILLNKIASMRRSHTAAMLNQGNQLRASREMVMKELNQAQQRISILATSLKEERAKSDTASQRFSSIVKILEEKKATADANVAKEKEHSEAEISQLKVTVSQLQKQSGEVEANRNEITRLKIIVAHLRADNTEAERIKCELDTRITELENLVAQLQKKNTEAEANKTKLEAKTNKLKNLVAQVSRQKTEVEEANKRKSAEINTMNDLVEQLRRQNAEAEEANQTLTQENQILRQEIEAFGADLTTSKQRETELKSKILALEETLRKERGARQSLVATLTAALNKNEVDLKRKGSEISSESDQDSDEVEQDEADEIWDDDDDGHVKKKIKLGDFDKMTSETFADSDLEELEDTEE